jgi:hypothetical protein
MCHTTKRNIMIRYGNPPYLECSSKGDKRLSAFYAKVNGATIESQYQAAKQLGDGRTNLSVNEAKGKRPVNYEEVAKLYSELWDRYIQEHPELLTLIINATGLSDIFGQPNHVCQATELWRIRNKHLFNAILEIQK